MALDKEFFDNLNKLEKHKTNIFLKDFFDSVNKLEKLAEEIKVETPLITSELSKQAIGLTKMLGEKKNEIAMHTKTQKEFDAVYDCIDYLEHLFR